MTLTEFIEEKIAVATEYRNLDENNPVEFVIEDANKNKYVVLVSHFEPDANTVPFNVLWINNDPSHIHYKVLQRRVDAASYDGVGYRHSWSVISTIDEMFTELQYWQQSYDPILGEIDDFGFLPAAVPQAGIFALTSNAVSEAVRASISTNDYRMSNARDPLAHSHAQYPATMIAGGKDGADDVIVYVANNDPVLGDVFVVTSISEDGLSVMGEWTAPADLDLPYIGPLPASLTVIGPTETVDGMTNHVLRANVTLDDGTVLESVQAVWSVISNHEWGAVGTNTGVFYAGDVLATEIVRVQAIWTHPESGVTITNYIDITIRNASGIVYLMSIAILGPADIDKDETGTYTVQATYSNGTTAIVTPNSFTSSNSEAGTFAGGILTPSPEQVFDKQTTLAASFTEGGYTRTTSRVITVHDTVIYPQSATISGAASLYPEFAESYVLTVAYSDGSTQVKTANWSLDDTTHASINASGQLTAAALTVPGDKNIVITATYTELGVTVSDTHPVVIEDPNVYPVSSAITGIASVNVGATAEYQLVVTYDDGSTVVVTPTDWNTSNGAIATIDDAGLLTAVAEGSVNVNAVYTESGVNLDATLAITVANAPIYAMRYGTATFANSQFTGGILEPLTAEQISYGVTNTQTPQGQQYEHWDNVQDFFDTVFTQTLPNTGGSINNLALGVDKYLYIAYDARISSLSIMDLVANLPITFDGVNWADDVLVPPETPTDPVALVTVNIGGQSQQWKIQRIDFAGAMTVSYSFTVNL